MQFRKTNNQFIIRLEKGEEIIALLTAFCQSNDIKSGIFQGIGAVSSAQLSAYQLDKKQYLRQEFSESLEISALLGNIALLEGKATIHCHGVLGRHDFSTISGHLDKAIVSATCEIVLEELPTTIERKPDDSIGLNLLNI